MTYLTIPPDEQMGLLRLATLTDEQLAQLKAALTAVPVLLSREAFLKGISAVKGLADSDQEKIVSALTYLNGYLATGNYELKEFVSDVRMALAEKQVSDDVIEKVDRALPKLLDIDTLRLRAKAVDLQVDHARVFQNARIITDVRPVFATDATSEVKSALVFHTLKIEYFQEADSHEFFIALDDRDIAHLRKALDRAEDKARTLRNLIFEKLQIKDFGAEAD